MPLGARAARRRSLRRGVGCLCLVAAAALAAAGCGESKADPPLDPGRLASIERLSRAQYKAIEAALASGLRLNSLTRAGRLQTRSAYDSAITRTLRACGRLDGNDVLLRELFRSCAGEARVLVPLIEGQKCSSPMTCSRAFRLARHRLRYLAARYTRHNRAVGATDLPRPCKRALSLTKADYAYIRRQRPVFKQTERATFKRSPAGLAAALVAQDRLDRASLADARRSLRRIRAHCR